MTQLAATFEKYSQQGFEVTCPSCGATTAEIRYRYFCREQISFIYYCSVCTLEFLRPLQVHQRQMESVEDAEHFHSSLFKSLHKKLIIDREIGEVSKYFGRVDFSMLDVGCGTGWISRIWADAGARVTGLEPSAVRAAFASERGIRVLTCYAEELAGSETYDLIVIRHVLEHLEDPKSILRTFASRLKPNGLLLVVIPNIDCIGRKIFDADWTWVLPWHCNFFNPHSLSNLLGECGFVIKKSYQTLSPLWYPQSFTRKFPHIGAMLKITPMTMLMFAPVVALGYITGHGENLTMIASHAKETN